MHLTGIFIRPIFTEKSSSVVENRLKKYMFVIHPNANKVIVKQVFKMIYGVVPVKVNILNYKATKTRTGTRNPGVSKSRKVAVITVPEGVTISIVGNKEEKSEKTNKK